MKVPLHKSQIFFYILLAFLVGVGIVSWTPTLLGVGVVSIKTSATVLLITGAVVLVVSAYRGTFGETPKGVERRRLGFLLGVLVLALSVGMLRFQSFQADRSRLLEFADREAGREGDEQLVSVLFRGYVAGEAKVSGDRRSFSFLVREVLSNGLVFPINERVLVTTQSYPQYRYGDVLVIQGALRTPENFDQFDYITYLRMQGIQTVSYFPEIRPSLQGLRLSRIEKSAVLGRRVLLDVKAKFQTALRRALNEPIASYASGILLGGRENIPKDLQDLFNRTSTSHMLAISGYNISIIGDMLILALVLLMPRRRAFWVSVVAIILFTILTGGSASVVRAAIMGLLLLFAQSYGRLHDITNGITLAAVAMVSLNPLILRFDVGFQLSFVAVLGLIYLVPILDHWFANVRLPRIGKQLIIASLAAQVAVLPLILYYFQTLSVIGVVANVLVLPWLPFAMLFAFATGLAGLVLPLAGKVVGLFAWALAAFQIGIIRVLGSLPFAAYDIGITWPWLVVLYGALVYGIIVFKRKGIGYGVKIVEHTKNV